MNSSSSLDQPLDNPGRTYKVARDFRRLLVCFGLQYLLVIGTNVFTASANPEPSLAVALLALLLTVILFVNVIFLLVTTYRLAADLHSTGGAILRTLCMLIPFGNILVLLGLNSSASAFLKERGVGVGLVGPSSADVERLRQAAQQA